MTKKTRRDKVARESMARLDRHNADRNTAIARAHAQRKPVDGMQRVQLASIADSLDEVDPMIRGAVIGPLTKQTMRTMRDVEADIVHPPGSPAAYQRLNRVELEERATEPIAAPYRDRRGEFVPPQGDPFVRRKDDGTIREEPPMQNSSDATFSSNERVRAKAGSSNFKRAGVAMRKYARFKVPGDIVEAIGIDRLTGIDFEVELTEEGILFRPAGTRPVQVPEWAKRKDTMSPVTGRVATTAHR